MSSGDPLRAFERLEVFAADMLAGYRRAKQENRFAEANRCLLEYAAARRRIRMGKEGLPDFFECCDRAIEGCV